MAKEKEHSYEHLISVHHFPFVFSLGFEMFLSDSFQQWCQVITFYLICVLKEVVYRLVKHSRAKLFKYSILNLYQCSILMLFSFAYQSTLFLKITSAAITIFNTAVEGNSKSPLCLKQVNLAKIGYCETLNKCGSSATSNSSDLHSLHFSFGSIDHRVKPKV